MRGRESARVVQREQTALSGTGILPFPAIRVFDGDRRKEPEGDCRPLRLDGSGAGTSPCEKEGTCPVYGGSKEASYPVRHTGVQI